MNIDELLKKQEEIEDRIFYLDMKDRWTKEDFDLNDELHLELKIIKERIVKKENDKYGKSNN